MKEINAAQLDTAEGIKMYDVNFQSAIKQKMQDSQELIGSLALKSTGKLPMNGNTDTVGSLSKYSSNNIQAPEQ